MALPCNSGCPLDELGELKDGLMEIYNLNRRKLTQEEAKQYDLVQIDKTVTEFVRQSEIWHLECNECKSFPEKKAVVIKQYCDFILQVLNNLSAIRQKRGGGDQCLAKKVQVA